MVEQTTATRARAPGGGASPVNGFSNLQLTLILAVISVLGIIGMLLFDGAADVIALLLAVAPLVFAIHQLWKHRSHTTR